MRLEAEKGRTPRSGDQEQYWGRIWTALQFLSLTCREVHVSPEPASSRSLLQRQSEGIETSLDQLHEKLNELRSVLDSVLILEVALGCQTGDSTMLRLCLPSRFIHKVRLVCESSLPRAEDGFESPGVSRGFPSLGGLGSH